MSREAYERARASRDPRKATAVRRGGPREVIDGRGSIDSRAFNERNELVGYTIDVADQHEPAIDVPEGRTRWRSSPGYGFGEVGGIQKRGRLGRNSDLRDLSDAISGRSDFQGNRAGPAVPLSIKLLGALIVILLVILIFLLVF